MIFQIGYLPIRFLFFSRAGSRKCVLASLRFSELDLNKDSWNERVGPIIALSLNIEGMDRVPLWSFNPLLLIKLVFDQKRCPKTFLAWLKEVDRCDRICVIKLRILSDLIITLNLKLSELLVRVVGLLILIHLWEVLVRVGRSVWLTISVVLTLQVLKMFLCVCLESQRLINFLLDKVFGVLVVNKANNVLDAQSNVCRGRSSDKTEGLILNVFHY